MSEKDVIEVAAPVMVRTPLGSSSMETPGPVNLMGLGLVLTKPSQKTVMASY